MAVSASFPLLVHNINGSLLLHRKTPMRETTAHFGDLSSLKLQLAIVKERLWKALPQPVREFPWKKAEDRLKLQLPIVKERLREAVPPMVKEFPWKKAEDLVSQRLVIIGEIGLKWWLVLFSVSSSLSDLVFSISRNKELVIPIGLLVGCLVTYCFNEVFQELVSKFEEGGGVRMSRQRQLLCISCIFVFLKFISTNYALQTRVFLLHVANGGLMQVLWLWISLQREGTDDEGSLATSSDQCR